MKQAIIYILTNKTNGKKYVGKTTGLFQNRLKDHFRNDSYIGNSLRKHGLDGFETQQVIYHKDDLDYWEQYFIAKLNTIYPNGYNLTAGGDGGERSEEAKKHMRKPKSPEGRAAIALSNNDPDRLKSMSEKLSGDNNPAKRPEVREKISMIAKEKGANKDYFATHPLIGEDNYQWLGPDKEIVCQNPNCRKVLKVRPNDPRKYCDWQCMKADPGRAERISLVQKNKTLSQSHLDNILIAQRKRRGIVTDIGRTKVLVCANPNCRKEVVVETWNPKKYCCRKCTFSDPAWRASIAQTRAKQSTTTLN